MTFTTTYEASAFINKYHVRFADRCTFPTATNPNAFDSLMRSRDFAKGEHAVVGVTFPATLNDGTATEIYMEPFGNDGWMYIERPVH